MPNIINEIKLDFKDVMLRPKRSTLISRNDVSTNSFCILQCEVTLLGNNRCIQIVIN